MAERYGIVTTTTLGGKRIRLSNLLVWAPPRGQVRNNWGGRGNPRSSASAMATTYECPDFCANHNPPLTLNEEGEVLEWMSTPNGFDTDKACKVRDRKKVELSKERRFHERGLTKKRGNKPKERAAIMRCAAVHIPSPTERKAEDLRLAINKRKKTNTNSPSELSRRKRALNCLTAKVTPAAVLHRYNRKGDVLHNPCCRKCVSRVNEQFNVLSARQLGLLIAILLQRGCVEVHPGPYKKGSKPGKHTNPEGANGDVFQAYRLKNHAVYNSEGEGDGLNFHGSNIHVVRKLAPVKERANGKSVDPTPCCTSSSPSPPIVPTPVSSPDVPHVPVATTSSAKPEIKSEAKTDEKEVVNCLRGYILTDTELRGACSNAFYADPNTVTSVKAICKTKGEQRMLEERHVKLCPAPFEVIEVSFEAPQQWVTFVPGLAFLCHYFRCTSSTLGFISRLWNLWCLGNLCWVSFFIVGLYFFSPIMLAISCFVSFAWYRKFKKWLSSSTFWCSHKGVYIPHMMTSILDANSVTFESTRAHQQFNRNCAMNVPDRFKADWEKFTSALGNETSKMSRGFRQSGLHASTSSSGRPFVGLFDEHPDYFELSPGLLVSPADAPVPKLRVALSVLSDALAPAVEKSTHMATETMKWVSKTAQSAKTNIQQKFEEASESYCTTQAPVLTPSEYHTIQDPGAGTSEDCPSDGSEDMPLYQSIGAATQAYVMDLREGLAAALSIPLQDMISIGSEDGHTRCVTDIYQQLSGQSNPSKTSLMAFDLMRNARISIGRLGQIASITDLAPELRTLLRDLSNSSLMVFSNMHDGLTHELTNSSAGVALCFEELKSMFTKLEASLSMFQLPKDLPRSQLLMITELTANMQLIGHQWKNISKLLSCGRLKNRFIVICSSINCLRRTLGSYCRSCREKIASMRDTEYKPVSQQQE